MKQNFTLTTKKKQSWKHIATNKEIIKTFKLQTKRLKQTNNKPVLQHVNKGDRTFNMVMIISWTMYA